MAGWRGLQSGLLVGWLLAGCGEQSLVPAGDGGLPPISRPPSTGSGVDAGAPPKVPDAGTDAGPLVRLAPATMLTGADLTKAEVLAADDDGIYWVTSANQLWMLPTGSDTPRQLAADPNPPLGVGLDTTCLLVRGDDIVWSAWITTAPYADQVPLHRTRKSGGDVVLFANSGCDSAQLAADGVYLYYPPPDGPRGTLVAFPIDADPGTPPQPLMSAGDDGVVAAVAVDDVHLYWTVYPIDKDVEPDEGETWVASKSGLLTGPTRIWGILAGDTWLLQPSGGDLYVASAGVSGSGVGRLDPHGGAASPLPLPAGSTLLVFGDWVVSATQAISYPNGKIYVAPAAAVAGDGSVAVEIASDVMIGPVIGPPGLVFVDAYGHLVAISPQDLGAAAAAGQR